jgi:flavin reductase (DIM6/NTAB) family NADH-FMN oxidoreductase RutF
MQDNQLGQLMKLGMRRLASGVCVLSARLSDGEPFVMTVSSVTSVSDNPPSLLVCINRQIQRHEELLPLGTRFAINLLSNAQSEVSNLCAGRYEDKNRLSLGRWNQDDWLFLADSQVSFFCVTDKVVSYGTHEILIGRIEKVKIHTDEVNPLIYANGQYGSFKSLI